MVVARYRCGQQGGAGAGQSGSAGACVATEPMTSSGLTDDDWQGRSGGTAEAAEGPPPPAAALRMYGPCSMGSSMCTAVSGICVLPDALIVLLASAGCACAHTAAAVVHMNAACAWTDVRSHHFCLVGTLLAVSSFGASLPCVCIAPAGHAGWKLHSFVERSARGSSLGTANILFFRAPRATWICFCLCICPRLSVPNALLGTGQFVSYTA